jgi:uncharacterized small protein (DUF1192 family)
MDYQAQIEKRQAEIARMQQEINMLQGELQAQNRTATTCHTSPAKCRVKNSPKKVVYASPPKRNTGYMGVTYDMVSNYEITNLVEKERQRTDAVRCTQQVDREYVQRIQQSPPCKRTQQEVISSGQNRFRNPELEAKTAALQAEFDALLAGRVSRPVSPKKEKGSSCTLDDNIQSFYAVMDEIKRNDRNKRHASPTRRLIN